MSKRQAEFQIHNQPMSEAEHRAANMMNSQAPQKATPAQLAQRKIREAKGSLQRRRNPATGSTPTAPSFSNIQSTSNFFSGMNSTAPANGANGANGINSAQPQQPQQAFTAPSTSIFNFTASSGSHPFAGSNPFSTPTTPATFGQQASAVGQQSSVFSQTPATQPSSNPFAASSTFAFGQPSGVNNSFPQAQTGSILSKSTPASSSFTFGGNPSGQSQTSIFGTKTQTDVLNNGESMDLSKESPLKKPATSDRPAGANSASLATSSSISSLSSFDPSKTDTSKDSNTQPYKPFSTFFPQKPFVQESQLSATALTAPDSTKTTAPVHDLVSQARDSEKDNLVTTNGPSVAPPFNPFAALKPPGEESAPASKVGTSFTFPATSGSVEREKMPKLTNEIQAAAPTNPFLGLQSVNKGNGVTEAGESMNTLMPAQHQSTFTVAPNQFAATTAASPTKYQTLFNPLQPFSSVSVENSSTPAASNPFEAFKSATSVKPAEPPVVSSGTTNGLFQTSKATSEVLPATAKSPTDTSPNNVSQEGGNHEEASELGRAKLSPTKHNPFANASSPFSQAAKGLEFPFKMDSTQSASPSGDAYEQSQKTDTETRHRAPSQTSNLFAQSLNQASAAFKGFTNLPSKQTQFESPTTTQTTPISVTQMTVGVEPANDTSSDSARELLRVKVKSHGPTNSPQELDNDSFYDYDKSYRLRSLNERLKKQVAGLDPDKHDFEPVIRFYATQRASIGHPMGGLYQRVKAGDKRRADETDGIDETSNTAKRARLDVGAAEADQPPAHPTFSFSAITSVSTSPQPAVAAPAPEGIVPQIFGLNPSNILSTSSQTPMAPSNTSSVFKSMPPEDNPSFGVQQRSNEPSPFKLASIVSPPKSSEQALQAPGVSAFTPTSNRTSAVPFGPQTNGNTATSLHVQPMSPIRPIVEPPKFLAAGGIDFMAAFANKAKENSARTEAENKAKRKAEDFDSDEDDEAEYERRVAEEDRAKKAKIESIAKVASGFTPVLSSASSATGASPATDQEGESARDASAEGSERSSKDEESRSEEAQSEPEQDGDYHDEEVEENEESEEDDDIQTAMAKSHAKAKNPYASTSDPKSLFHRITKPDAPDSENAGKTDAASSPPQPAITSVLQAPPGSGLFGSRPSTPNQDSPTPFGTSIFSKTGSNAPFGDNTWKPGSLIKFGTPSAPIVNITPATPLAKTNGDSTHSPFSTFSAAASPGSKPVAAATADDESTPKTSFSVFGATAFTEKSTSELDVNPPKPFGALFGDASKKTTVNQSSAAKVGFSFGGPDKPGMSPLLAPSNISSAITSRATSPGFTDNDSAAESTADEQTADPQLDFMASRPGEEDEEVLFEVRTKVMEYRSQPELIGIGSDDEPGWKTRGLGPLRLLKNSATGQTRIVMRSEPGANVIINSPLVRDNTYTVTASGKEGGTLKMGIVSKGKYKNWVFKIKYLRVAHELVEYLKKNEPNLQGKKVSTPPKASSPPKA